MKILLTILLILTATPRAFSQFDVEQKRKITQRLADGNDCLEQQKYITAYSITQDSIITTLTNENQSLKFAIDYSVMKADSLFTQTSTLERNLAVIKERSYRKSNALLIVSGALAILTFYTLNK